MGNSYPGFPALSQHQEQVGNYNQKDEAAEDRDKCLNSAKEGNNIKEH